MNAPVFIVGEARSGTSIAHRCLLHHPAFRLASGSTTALAETSAFVQPLALLRDFSDAPGMWEYVLRNEQVAQEVLSSNARFEWQARRSWRAYRLAKKARVASGALWRLGGYPSILRNYFSAAQKVRGQRRLLDKSPTHVFTIPEIFWTFPDARVIYMARDPVETLASYRKRLKRERDAGHDEAGLQWLHVDGDGMANRLAGNWRRVCRAHKKWPGQVAVIRYDRFVASFAEVMPALLTWLGEEVVVIEPGEAGEQWDADPQLMSGLRASSTDYSEYVPHEEAEVLRKSLESAVGFLAPAELSVARRSSTAR